MRIATLSCFTLALCLGACATPQTGTPAAQDAGYPPDDSMTPWFARMLRNIGGDYGVMVLQGPAWTNQALQKCYGYETQFHVTSGGPYLTSRYRDDVRRCLVLDYLAYKDNQGATQHNAQAGNPSVFMEATQARWSYWFQIAGFSTPDTMFTFLRVSASMARPYEMAVLNSQPSNVPASQARTIGGW